MTELEKELLEALKALLDASGRSLLDKMNVVRLEYAQCAARDAIANAEGERNEPRTEALSR